MGSVVILKRNTGVISLSVNSLLVLLIGVVPVISIARAGFVYNLCRRAAYTAYTELIYSADN